MSLPKGTYLNTAPLEVGEVVRPSGHYYLITRVILVMTVHNGMRTCNVLEDKNGHIKFEYQYDVRALLQMPVVCKDVYG